MRIPRSGVSPLSKRLLRIVGPDATRFLNGLTTTRLLPNVIKKKQHTISENENRHAVLGELIDLDKNWGVMHEDIYDPDQNILIRRDGLNSMFLNSKGRIVNDCFMYSNPFHNIDQQFANDISQPNFLVEFDASFSMQLQMLLKLHKLSARIKIDQLNTHHSYYYYNDSVEFDEWLDEVQYKYFTTMDPTSALQEANLFIEDEIVFNADFSKNIVGFAIDNRIPNFGIKFITNKPISVEKATEDKIPLHQLFSDQFKSKFAVDATTEDSIIKRRFLNGLFETADAPRGTSLLPFETNLDYVNGLSLDKGCYVGQELTIRTFNNGIIRKRVLPVQFFTLDRLESVEQQESIELNPDDEVNEYISKINLSSTSKLDVSPMDSAEAVPPAMATSGALSPFGSTSKPIRKRKTSSGKILSINANLGFMLMNLSDLEKSSFYQIEIPSLESGGNGVKKIGIRVFRPDWWPEEEE